MAILVIVPIGAASDFPGSEGVWVKECRSPEDVMEALELAADAAVLVSDPLRGDGLSAVAEAVSRCAYRVIEVRTLGWDGVTESVLSAACRGVISGFGLAGVPAAVALLQRESA